MILNLHSFRLCGNIERLETRCDDLQRNLDESRVQQQSHQLLQRRRRRRSSRSREDQVQFSA
jgi:hypothetical protein